jgi:hypothetical protein
VANGSERSEKLGYGTRLHQNLCVLAALVESLRPELYSGTDARRMTELFAWGERLCATGKALAAQRVVDTGAWESTGARTAAEWLGRVSGQTAGQAAEAIETVKRMRNQPQVEEAARAGTLSPEQSAAVTSAAQQAPEKADELLDQAQADDLLALRARAKQIKAAADEQTEKNRDRRIHAGRYLRTWTDNDGSGRLIGRFTPDALAVIRSALHPFQEEAFAAARQTATRERRECLAADALVAMARCATGQDHPPDPATAHANDHGRGDCPGGDPATTDANDHGRGDCPGGDPATTDANDHGCGDCPGGDPATTHANDHGCGDRPGGDPVGDRPTGTTPGDRPCGPDTPPDPTAPGGAGPARSRHSGGSGRDAIRTRRPATVIVRIDYAALIRGYRQGEECCEIDGIGLVSVATVRAMMADAFLAAVVTDGIDIRSVVHLGRTVTATQRTALLARDPECVVPGCHVRFGLEIDHVADWANTKVTTIDRLARLCHHHHAQKTRDGWRLDGRPGQWQWIGPEGTRSDPPPGPDTPDRSPPSPEGPGDRHDPCRHDGGAPTANRSLFDPAEESFPP